MREETNRRKTPGSNLNPDLIREGLKSLRARVVEGFAFFCQFKDRSVTVTVFTGIIYSRALSLSPPLTHTYGHCSL